MGEGKHSHAACSRPHIALDSVTFQQHHFRAFRCTSPGQSCAGIAAELASRAAEEQAA